MTDRRRAGHRRSWRLASDRAADDPAALHGGLAPWRCSRAASARGVRRRRHRPVGRRRPPGATGSGEIEDQLNFFHWAEYDDPEVFEALHRGVRATTKIDIYASNEEVIAKLKAAAGTSGYDIVVPTGVYIPQMVQLDLLEELDLVEDPELREHREPVHEPAVGPGQQALGLQGLGLDRLDLRQDEGIGDDRDVGRLHRGRAGRGQRQDLGPGHTRRT